MDGGRLDGYTMSSPCEPNGSGELKYNLHYGWCTGRLFMYYTDTQHKSHNTCFNKLSKEYSLWNCEFCGSLRYAKAALNSLFYFLTKMLFLHACRIN